MHVFKGPFHAVAGRNSKLRQLTGYSGNYVYTMSQSQSIALLRIYCYVFKASCTTMLALKGGQEELCKWLFNLEMSQILLLNFMRTKCNNADFDRRNVVKT